MIHERFYNYPIIVVIISFMIKKVVLVTGASSGLGKSIAQFLSKKGFKVYGTSRSLGKDINGVTILKMDVTKKDEIKAALSIIIQIEQRLDVLINNAGIGMTAPLEDSNTADFKNVIDTNLVGAYETVKTVLPPMRKQGSGLIVNVSSIASKFGLQYRSAYCASKATMDGLTKALRMEVKKFGIKICSIQLGDIRTNIKDHLIVNLKKDSVYKASFERCYKIINDDVAFALMPDFFAEKVYGIINSKNVKRSYVLGKPMQKVIVILKRILPDSWFEKIINNYYRV